MRQIDISFSFFIFILVIIIPVSSIFSTGTQDNTDIPIRIGILPDADSLPYLLAREKGLYGKHNAEVELISFHSPVERDAAFQAGQIDGFIGDTLGAIFLEQGGVDITVTSNTSGRYGIAAAPGTGITNLGQLSNRPIGISSNTIIEYAVHALFSHAGVDEKLISVIPVPKIPVRMELLLQGSIPAATLPEPLYSLVIARGALPVSDTGILPYAPGIMIFSSVTVREKQPELRRIYQAYYEAAKLIDAAPEDYRDFLISGANFPPDIRDSYRFVHYGKPEIPSEAEITAVAEWMNTRGLSETMPLYRDFISDSWNLDFLD